MNKWKTSLHLNHLDGEIKTDHFSTNTGIFQGDSPSGLLSILSLLQLSWLLNTSNIGYRINHQGDIISHLLFMDNLKLFAANNNQLASVIRIVHKFSDDIGMSFGIDRCKKYMILKSELSSKHAFEAINLYAIPALLYGFPVLDWTITELKIIDRETRKMLLQYHAMHNQSDVTRLYLPRKNGDRGLINMTNHYNNAIINFSSCLLNSEEQFLKLTSNWQITRGEKPIHQKAQRYCDEIGHDIQQLAAMRKLPRKIAIKSAHINKLEAELKRKNMHGQFAKYLDQPHVDKERSNQWLKSSTLKRSTESTIAAIQEQAISTKYTENHVFNVEDDGYMSNLPCRKRNHPPHHIRLRWSFTNKIPRTP